MSVIQLGPWPRGRKAGKETLAIAFYFSGALVKKYSTPDIAGTADSVSPSVSHYQLIQEVPGYRWLKGNEYVFEMKTIDGRTLAFDSVTRGLKQP